MAKRSISGAEIQAYLQGALDRSKVCSGVTVIRVYEQETKVANWDAEYEVAIGTTISGDCQRIFISAKLELQKQYDLLIED
jgi:hypothetical protein